MQGGNFQGPSSFAGGIYNVFTLLITRREGEQLAGGARGACSGRLERPLFMRSEETVSLVFLSG